MSKRGKGKPVDALDAVCKAHKECLHCASEVYGANRGDRCLGDNVQYSNAVGWNSSKFESFCTFHDADTCERAICECDKAFFNALFAVKESYNQQYHTFYGNFDSTDQANCPSSFSSSNKNCCNNADKSTSFKFYNANKQQCCNDGSLQELGQLC